MSRFRQRILTPNSGNILGTLISLQHDGCRIISCCPHFTHGPHPTVQGYIVIVDEPNEEVAALNRQVQRLRQALNEERDE